MKLPILSFALLVVSVPPAARAQGLVYSFEGLEDACVALGDVDGDGHPELALAQAGIGPLTGRLSIRSGRTGVELAGIAGVAAGDGFGYALARVDDLDGDGHDDIAVAVPLGPSPHVDLVSSASGARIGSLAPSVAGEFGRVLASGGDVDGDGIGELLVGAPTPGPGAAGGFVEVLSPATGTALRTHVAIDVAALAFLGDVDGDARDDYAIGIPGRASGFGPGRVEVRSGASGAPLYELAGSALYQGFGRALAGVGDIDGDGAGDLLIGAPGEQIQPYTTGAAHLVSGTTGALLARFTPPWAGIVLFGQSVCSIGDYDGDGTPDLVVMHAQAWVGGVIKNTGSAYVFSGATGAQLEQMFLYGLFGPVSDAGDVNLDGVHDLLVACLGTGATFSSALLLGAAPPLESFCYGKKTSGGCTPKLEWSGAPSLSVGDELTVSARSLPPRAPTVLSWSLSGLTWPNNNGPMCLTPPLVRAVAGGSGGGPGSCSGGLDFTFSRSYLAAFGLTAGSDVFVQAWVRDPGQAASRPVATTYGLRFTVWP